MATDNPNKSTRDSICAIDYEDSWKEILSKDYKQTTKCDMDINIVMSCPLHENKMRKDSDMWRAKKYGEIDFAGLLSYRLCKNHLGEFFLWRR
jgi:hypothetical protein